MVSQNDMGVMMTSRHGSGCDCCCPWANHSTLLLPATQPPKCQQLASQLFRDDCSCSEVAGYKPQVPPCSAGHCIAVRCTACQQPCHTYLCWVAPGQLPKQLQARRERPTDCCHVGKLAQSCGRACCHVQPRGRCTSVQVHLQATECRGGTAASGHTAATSCLRSNHTAGNTECKCR